MIKKRELKPRMNTSLSKLRSCYTLILHVMNAIMCQATTSRFRLQTTFLQAPKLVQRTSLLNASTRTIFHKILNPISSSRLLSGCPLHFHQNPKLRERIKIHMPSTQCLFTSFSIQTEKNMRLNIQLTRFPIPEKKTMWIHITHTNSIAKK